MYNYEEIPHVTHSLFQPPIRHAMGGLKGLVRRAKQERARATVAALLTAGSQVLEKRGYASASMDKIAERAGVSVGTAYQYYANKDALFEDLFRRDSERLLGELESHQPNVSLDRATQLAEFLSIGGRSVHLNPEVFQELERVPRLKLLLPEFTRRVEDAVTRFVSGLRPDLTPDEIRLKSRLIVAAAHGLGRLSGRAELDEGLLSEFLAMVSGYVLTSSASQ